MGRDAEPYLVGVSAVTYKERRFCSEYVTCNGNGTEAARNAGYSEHTAAEIACENLKKPHIKEEIARIEDIRARDIQQEFKDIAGEAMERMVQMMRDPEAPPSVRARLMQNLIDYGGYKPEEKIKGSLSFYEELKKIRKENDKGD